VNMYTGVVFFVFSFVFSLTYPYCVYYYLYTVYVLSIGALFAATKDFPQGLERYNLLANLTSNLISPNVPVSHYYGVGVKTPTAFSYANVTKEEELSAAFRKGPTKVVNGDGDGTVPLRSLQSVENKWQGVDVLTFKNQSHTGVLKSTEYIAAVLKLVSYT
jgi:hypothetical protein